MAKRSHSVSEESDTNVDGVNPPEGEVFDIKTMISDIMYVLGDVKVPLDDTVDLMESILENQMNILVIEAEKNMNLRGGQEISHEDLLFLLRKNKLKLKRLLKYIRSLDDLQQSDGTLGPIPGDDFPGAKIPKKGRKRLKQCMNFLSVIQDMKEFTSVLHDKSIIDHQTRKRQERITLWLESLAEEEHRHYLKKKSEVFFCQDETGFKQWLLKTNATKCNFTALAIRIIYYFLYETISEILDQVLHTRAKKYVQDQDLLAKERRALRRAARKKQKSKRRSKNNAHGSKVKKDKAGTSTLNDNMGEITVTDSTSRIAIIAHEIMDAHAFLQEPPLITKFFWGNPLVAKKKTRLICLADYETLNV